MEDKEIKIIDEIEPNNEPVTIICGGDEGEGCMSGAIINTTPLNIKSAKKIRKLKLKEEKQKAKRIKRKIKLQKQNKK